MMNHFTLNSLVWIHIIIDRIYQYQLLQNNNSKMTEVQQAFPITQDPDWFNKTRTLIVSSRGMTGHQRNFMLNLFSLLPHSKKQFKLDKQDVRQQIEELCETHKCRYFLYFQVKKKIKFSIWIGRYPEGPSMKLLVNGMVLTKDVKFQGNNVKGARHILSFEKHMEDSPKLKILKTLLTGALNVPKYHPKSTSVIDHVLNFTCEGDLVSFRNYQIFREAVNKETDKLKLYEIGPRFLMNPQVILDGIMGGEVLYRSQIVKKVARKNKTKPRNFDEEDQKERKINIFGEQEQ